MKHEPFSDLRGLTSTLGVASHLNDILLQPLLPLPNFPATRDCIFHVTVKHHGGANMNACQACSLNN